MWNKDTEVPRIIALQNSALEAIKSFGIEKCIYDFVRLKIELILPRD